MEEDFRVKQILKKLTKLQCPLVGDGKDTWLSEVLFKPGLDRFNLIQWMLKMLEISGIDITEKQMSVENKIKEMQVILSTFGVCCEKNKDVIEGTASQTKQIRFWEKLIEVILNRMDLENSNTGSSNFNKRCNQTSKSYQSSCEAISYICESLNFKHAFDTELELFPSYLETDIKSAITKHPSYLFSKQFKDNLPKETNSFKTSSLASKRIGKFTFTIDETTECKIPHENVVNNIEKDISVTVNKIQNCVEDFIQASDSLKLYISDVQPDEFVDIGPSFKTAEEKLHSFLQLKNSLNSLVSADSELEVIKSQISTLQMPSSCLSDSKLGEYIQIISDVKENS